MSDSTNSSLLFSQECTDSTFEEIPVIDIQDAWSPDSTKRKALAYRIRDACVNVGFFYITSHGIPESVINQALDAAKAYFSLPEKTKMKLDIHETPNFKGYTALLGENTDSKGLGDLHEGFDLGWEPAVTPSQFEHSSIPRDDGVMSGGNVWPDLPGFREPVLDYYHKVVHIGKLLFPLFALALDLPESYFNDKITKPAAIMRLLHYPPQSPTSFETDPDGRQIGIGAHTDYECFTILWQDSNGGLQVQNTAGTWIDAVPIPNTLVVNLGDQLARWTNDVFKSTLHRVINLSGAERYSIPLFFGTDYNVLLEPIPTCVSPDTPYKYEIMNAGDYVKSRLEATYAHSATT